MASLIMDLTFYIYALMPLCPYILAYSVYFTLLYRDIEKFNAEEIKNLIKEIDNISTLIISFM